MRRGEIHTSSHAQQRWRERSPPDAPVLEAAWEQGTRLTDVERALQADECRYHRGSETVLVRRGRTLVTVLLAYGDEELAQAVSELEQNLETDGGPEVCPACGEPPEEIYRCQRCGYDLVDNMGDRQ